MINDIKKDLEANLLDGDKVQEGQMIASTEVLEWVEELTEIILTEIKDWAINNGITDKKSFIALRNYLDSLLTTKEDDK
jgi:hypothetical protein